MVGKEPAIRKQSHYLIHTHSRLVAAGYRKSLAKTCRKGVGIGESTLRS